MEDTTAEVCDDAVYSEPKPWQRFYMGYKGRFVDDCVLSFYEGRRTVRLAQAPSAKTVARRSGLQLDKHSDPALTGTTVWDGAVVLSHYLSETDALHQLRSNRGDSGLVSFELGAGTGAFSLSLLACRCVSHAVITDIPDMLPHLHHNIAKNSDVVIPSQAVVRPLQWGAQEDMRQSRPFQAPFDLIVGADLIYYTYSDSTSHSALLHQTLKCLSGPSSVTYVALSLHQTLKCFSCVYQDPLLLQPKRSRVISQPRFCADERIIDHIPDEFRVHNVLVVRLTSV